jgi:glycosyltransferase involved in cell wall biosynthesis
MTLRVKMIPEIKQVVTGESGIHTIVRKYAQYFPKYGMEIVGKDADDFDIFVVHAGMMETPYPANVAAVSMMHGLYWTAMYNASNWEWKANADVINSMRHAHVITCPSTWVAETIQRDMHRNPVVVPHGVDWQEWQHNEPKEGYVIGYAKNRKGMDVCNPDFLNPLAYAFPETHFAATFAPDNPEPNIREFGVLPYPQMKQLVQRAEVFVSCVRETFGIAILEAMAAGLPIVGWREGGIVDLVEHGVNGYLAKPGDMGDLFQGLDYCMQHRSQLGANGREMAKKWTWDAVCENLHDVFLYAIAKAKEPPTCAIVIPSYKYAKVVGGAIESAMQQTYEMLTDIVVVDDCSPDEGETERLVKTYIQRDKRVKYIRLPVNSGVAVARNTGIYNVDTKYICCLDSDDKILPRFLEACIPPLEKDRSLGITFSSMEAIALDGRVYETRWPPDMPLFDQQQSGKNQVPTCCVFRRELWNNLGGYRARYAPEGCGSEDAEFFLRAGANGWGYQKATTARMFIYSLGGNTTGRKDYREPNWLSMHPWTKDGQHPVASLATPKRGSHPARFYDSPAISVVIPVGPGHEFDIVNALDSLEAQDFRMWEAIIVLDNVDEELISPVLKSYPYIRVFRTKANAQGTGAARNLGASQARAGLLVFLDADDYLLPEVLSSMLDEFSKGEAIVYGDCQANAIVDDVKKLDERMQRQILERNQKTKKTIIRFPAADYNCELAQSMPNSDDPDSLYLVAHITCLIPKLWHDAIGGFDEKMVSWEDVDWHWRLSKAGYCYRRLHKDLFMYQLSSGGRREKGRENWKSLLQYLKGKYKEMPNVPCRSCGGRGTPPPIKQIVDQGSEEKKVMFSDESLIKCEYMHPNRGQHSVIGAATRTKYGQRAGGDVFFVHRDDVAAQPMYFRPIQLDNISVPQPTVAPPPPPPSVVVNPAQPASAPVEETPATTESIPKNLLTDVEKPEGEKPAPAPEPIPDIPAGEIKATIIGEYDELDLRLIPSITPAIAKQMREIGLTTPRAIMDSGPEGLQAIKGVGETRSLVIVQYVAKKAGL